MQDGPNLLKFSLQAVILLSQSVRSRSRVLEHRFLVWLVVLSKLAPHLEAEQRTVDTLDLLDSVALASLKGKWCSHCSFYPFPPSLLHMTPDLLAPGHLYYLSSAPVLLCHIPITSFRREDKGSTPAARDAVLHDPPVGWLADGFLAHDQYSCASLQAHHDAPAPRHCIIVKWPDFEGYGFNLHAEKSKPGQYIGKVDENSPAEKAGLLEDDRIIEVNGVNIANENHKQRWAALAAGLSLSGSRLLWVRPVRSRGEGVVAKLMSDRIHAFIGLNVPRPVSCLPSLSLR
ncbi:Na(+)/H(+) exchange regulatory cofactor NHE-RF1 [Portunus trituberculatus]|uniref:Na(+)/H(+) exchange regulatory cofactor NHE-RF1 n=1 Tax=Portunus trituberculatus TaxID=210409 RepID=A0A5B7EXH8_PORTR|nr:Na(+)/H(+) exchange regulatory cofactor NHE-RF1 [Portunus trituberculatus]